MNENMIMARFESVEEAKKIYDILEDSTKKNLTNFNVLQVVLLKNEDGRISVLDQHTEVFSEFGKTMIGGVAGIVLGVIIGPFAGFVLGGIGAMIGSGFDITEQTEAESMLYQMYSRIYSGDIAILAIVQEEDELEFNSIVGKTAIEIYRWDAAEIKEEAEYADSLKGGFFNSIKEKFFEERNELRMKKVKEYKDSLKEEFDKKDKEK